MTPVLLGRLADVASAASVRALAPSPSPTRTPSQGGEGVKAGPIGLVVILVLCVACYFLFRSMSRHMRKVREEFPGQTTFPAAAPVPGRPADTAAGTVAAAAEPDEAHPRDVDR